MEDDSARGFLLGFISGEGSFMIEVGAVQRRRWNVNISPKFALLVHEDKILQTLKEETGLGNVHTQSNRSQWAIASIDECLELCEIIDSSDTELFNQTKKREQYENWKTCVQMIDRGEHTTKEGAHKLVDLSFDLGKENQRKYSRQYYHDEIDKAGDYICGGTTNTGGECKRHVSEPDNTCQWH